jgi:hypothetical protein
MPTTKKSAKAFDETNISAWAIIEAEKKKRDEKTAKLRTARLAKETEELLAHTPGRARAKAIRRKIPKL